MEKTTFTLLFLLLFSAACWATQGYRCLFHVHTVFSADGHSTIDEIANYAKRSGYNCIEFSDHGDSFKSTDDFLNYRDQIDNLNQDDIFATIAGIEVTVGNQPQGKNDCHINEITLSSNPLLYDSKYSKEQGLDVVGILRYQGASIVLNHYRTCPAWHNIAENFNGIEVFNEYLGGTSDLQLYLELMRNEWRGFVIGGVDLHHKAQIEEGIETFVFSQRLTRDSIFKAVVDGNTIAAVGLRGIDIDPIPAKQFYDIGKNGFRIDMEIRMELLTPISLPQCQVYRDGVAYKKIKVAKGNALGKKEIHFTDSKPGCYTMVIPGIMVTSPLCFKKFVLLPEIPDVNNKKPKQEPVLGENVIRVKKVRVTKITDTIFHTGPIEIITEDEDKARRFRFYNICGKDNLLFSDNGTIVSCRDPLFTVYRQSQDSEIALRAGGECVTTIISQEGCIRALRSGYFIGIDENNFLAVEQPPLSTEEFYFITENKGVGEGEVFTACDSHGNFRFSDMGVLLSCDETYEMKTRKVEGKELLRLDGAPQIVTVNAYFLLLR